MVLLLVQRRALGKRLRNRFVESPIRPEYLLRDLCRHEAAFRLLDALIAERELVLHPTQRGRVGDLLGDASAVAAVGEHEDPDALLELVPELVQLVVDELAVVEHPGLVEPVGLVAIDVRDLPSVSGVGEEEDVARLQTRGGVRDGALHRVTRGLRSLQELRLVPPGPGDLLHVLGIGLASDELAGPAGIVARIDLVQPDVQ